MLGLALLGEMSLYLILLTDFQSAITELLADENQPQGRAFTVITLPCTK